MVTMTELHKYGKTKFIMPGTAACPGCPLQVGMRQLAMALDGKFVMVIPAGCSSVIPGTAPFTAYTVPTLHVPFASSPAVASGIVRAIRQRGNNGPVVVWAGDGATADIGIATLSGAAYRNEDILYIMADNEAYMNTGIQASGTTPWMAWTTTSPRGKTEGEKDVALIVLMHGVPYVATASIAYPMDFIEKIRRAVQIKGFKFIHLLAPCPPGWKMDDAYTIRAARLAVETGAFILWEYNQGKFNISPASLIYKDKAKRKSLEEYLKIQGRFAHLKPEDIKLLEERIDEKWRFVLKLAEMYK
ncbi:MAG: 3-methyl-2-oxobutanoate dehydrogenase subunit beta [Vulcanisaeta sp. AZ3]|jgi:pyruvate ferredoxin oxidoreductase beta subunit